MARTSAARVPAPAVRRGRITRLGRPEMVGLRGIWVGYDVAGRRIEVLRDAGLSIENGELVAVVGRSGSGKSTLLHVAGGMATPDRGQVLVGGEDVSAMSTNRRAAWRRTHVGFVFQSFHLIAGLDVSENVALPLVLGGAARKEALARANAMIEAVGLSERRSHTPAELSGGEMQRVAIARALVNDPAVVLADEPTGNLDATTAAHVLDLLLERVRATATTCVLVTHDPLIAERADRVLTMVDGVIS